MDASPKHAAWRGEIRSIQASKARILERTLSPTNTLISSPAPLLLRQRLSRSIEANGVRGALAHSCHRLFHPLNGRNKWTRAFRSVATLPATLAPEPSHPFDVRYGTDTGGYLSTTDPQKRFRSAYSRAPYHGVAPSAISR